MKTKSVVIILLIGFITGILFVGISAVAINKAKPFLKKQRIC